MDWIIFAIIFAIIWALLIRDIRKKLKAQKKDSFHLQEMEVVIECTKCKRFKTRKFKRGDYIMKEEKKCKCKKGKQVITKIYHVKKKSEKQLKWDKQMEKWQY